MDMKFGLGLKLALGGFSKVKAANEKLLKLGKIARLDQKEMEKLGQSAKKLERIDFKLGLAKNQISEFKDKLSSNVAKTLSLAVPVKLAGDYESALADFNNAAKLDDTELKSINEYFLKLSNQSNIAATDIAKLGQNIAKMGVPKDDLKGYLSTATKLSNALGISSDETSEILASLNAHFKLNSDEALALGDDIFTLGNSFNASSKDIARLSARLGQNAKMFGLNASELAVLSASFLDVAKGEGQAEMMLSSLSDGLMNINNLSTKSKELLSTLGMDAKQIEIGMKIDAKATLDLFFQRLKITKKASENEYNELINTMFGANATLINAFIDNLDKYEQASANIGKNKGAIEAENKAIKELFNNKTSTFANNLKNLSIQFGNVLLPSVAAVIDKINSLFALLQDFITLHPNVFKAVSLSIAAFVSFGVVLSSFKLIFAVFKIGIFGVIKNILFLKGAISPLCKMLNFSLITSLKKTSKSFLAGAKSAFIFNKNLLAVSFNGIKGGAVAFAGVLKGGFTKAISLACLALRGFKLALLSNPFTAVAVAPPPLFL